MNLIEIINAPDSLVKIKISLWNSTTLARYDLLGHFQSIHLGSPRFAIRRKTKEVVKELK
jgi:hypothetical protein